AVLPGGAAARAGLQAGDVLLRHDSARLVSLADLTRALRDAPLGATVTYWREGKQGKARLALGRPGMVIDPRPVARALADWRPADEQLLLRGTGHKPLPGTRLE